ncbi:processive 1,2-diacylglycerol beta-glucosyltransferase [Bacillus sp. OV166]|uniref:MGDG synthase family glycosyltransferase n=1 Tax=Bacillus sp. OV166 TaxID=1882763 RepID=UPI000A2AA468|nr:glycosyltransferase [Bacillus sp. OV166]SMQ77441.1 processive 1,2-diacylglycerol beta-glucosyltransferase [Bacillus sp. OV166]
MNKSANDKILILSAKFGDGHKQVATAIFEAIEFTLPNVEPIILDVLEWLHPFLYPVSNYFYRRIIKKFPQVYSYLYKSTREKNSFSDKLNALLTVGMGSLLEIVEKINPTVVVSTYPFAASIMSKLKEQGLIDIPVVTIITDYTDHSFWIHPFTDQYIVGSNQVRDRLICLGVENYKINNTGIPICQKFLKQQSREVLASKYGLNSNQFTILVMGGGDGFIGKDLSNFQAFEDLTSQVQFIIICGRNKRLRKQIEEELKTSKHHFLVTGFSDSVNELMAISDLLISKPGGVTISEALAMELPLLIYNPLPGQEEDNADYLVNAGLAIKAENKMELISKIHHMLDDSIPLLSIRKKIRKYQTKSATFDALDVIVRAVELGREEQTVVV